MQHIDEGTLHEYLDRGGDQDPSQHTVTEHLAACAACRLRLEEASSFRAQSANILRTASPVRRAAPSFESIVARSTAQRDVSDTAVDTDLSVAVPVTRRRMGVPRLAWAATMVLAVGAGWMANSLYRTGALDERNTTATIREDARPASPDAEAARPAVADAAAAAVEPGTAPATRAAGTESSGSQSSPGTRAATQGFGGAGAAANQTAPAPPLAAAGRREATAENQAAEKARQAGNEPLGAPMPPPSAGQQAADVQPARPLLVPREQVSSRSIVTGETIARAASAADSAAARRLLGPGAWRRVSAAEAAQSMRGALALAEGLPLIGIEMADAADETPARVRVRQESAPGDTVEIVQYAPERERTTPDNVFIRLAQDRQGATMYRLLRNNDRVLVVAGEAFAAVERVAGLLTIGGLPQ